MTGRRAVVGLSLLSALLFCAFAAQSASAVKAKNTTLFTCKSVGKEKGDFKDAHCDEKVEPNKGEFAHVKIPNDVTTEVSATNSTVTNSTKESEPAVLKSKVGLVAVEITCTTTENNAKESLIHNAQTKSGEKEELTTHTITGTGKTLFKACTVNKPAKCTVKEPIEAKVTGEAVEGLGEKANEMGLELKGSGAEETFAEITFEGAECGLKGKTFKVKGSVIGTSGPTTESSQTNHWSGATAVYTPKKEMQKLKLGVEAAELSLITTATENTTKTPLAATTCTTTSNC
jgi:hypothetical protein